MSRGACGPIVVATTGADGIAGLTVARRLAAADGRRVIVLSAVELPPPALGFDTVPYVPDTAACFAGQHARVERQLATAGVASLGWETRVVLDEPAHAIAEAARDCRASLIVLGTGRHDLAGRIFGEVVLRTIRRAPCPVLAVPAHPFDAADFAPPRIAVAAIDFSAASLVSAQAALDLLATDGTLYLVHVWQHPILEPIPEPMHEAALEASLRARLDAVCGSLDTGGRDVTILTAAIVGVPGDALSDFARTRGAALIAAGRQGHGMLELLFVGRVTTALVREAPCSVLVTPESPT